MHHLLRLIAATAITTVTIALFSGVQQAASEPPSWMGMDRVSSVAMWERHAKIEENWSPPAWYPQETQTQLWAIDEMDDQVGSVGPDLGLRSKGAFVFDVDTGNVLLAQGADERRAVASLTKMVSALTMVSEDPDLDKEHCLDESIRPSWPGAITRLPRNTCTTGWDLLGAALVRSDNGAAFAFASVAQMDNFHFVDRMNDVARDLGMSNSTFADPTGVADENMSTPRDMTKAILAAALHPQVGVVTNAPYWDLTDSRDGEGRRFHSTNTLRRKKGINVEFLAAKTGYTDTALHCYSAVVRTRAGRTFAMTFMGAKRSKSPT